MILQAAFTHTHAFAYSARNTASVLAAQIKSFLCKPEMACVHHVTVSLPHSNNKAGWWPSCSANSATLLLTAHACLKLRNVYSRCNCNTPSPTIGCQSGIWRNNSGYSASLTCGAPARQASHCIWFNSSLICFSMWILSCFAVF